MNWKFWKRKNKPEAPGLPAPDPYIYSSVEGVVNSVMFDYIEVNHKRIYCRRPMVRLGQAVSKGQVVGKK